MSCMWVGTGTVGSFRGTVRHRRDHFSQSTPLVTDRSKVAALTRHSVKLAVAIYRPPVTNVKNFLQPVIFSDLPL